MKTARDIAQIYETILERFGEPIGDAVDAGEGVADERGGHPHKGPDMGNRGWGADMCETCDAMMMLGESTCQSCGMMAKEMDEDDAAMAVGDDGTGDLVGKEISIGGGKASVKPSAPKSSSSTEKQKTGPTVDWSGMDEADEMDQVNLGISSRWGGVGSGHDFDDDVKEPEEVGAKLDPRDSVDVKKNDSSPMPLNIDEEDSFVDKAGKAARGVVSKTFDNYGKVATAMSKVPGIPGVAKGALAGAGKFNKELGKIAKGDDVDEVAPPGGEKVVKALKKQKGVKNPWAVAWSLKNKGAKFKK